jgi:hypothetical protein
LNSKKESDEMRHLIIGYGQVGQAIRQNLNGEVETLDLSESMNPGREFDIIHICFPWSADFVSDVNSYLKQYSCKAMIVHSTVKFGTTEKIDFENKAYSPVRGRHLNGFVSDMRKYVKYIWCANDEVADIIRYAFVVNYELVTDLRSLECAKLMSTTYMTVCVLFEKWLYKFCEKNDLDYDFMYREWNTSYNAGIKENWKRPVYTHQDGAIGGHCLLPNLDLIDDDFIKVVKLLNERYGE